MTLPSTPISLRKTIAIRLEKIGIDNSFDEAKWLICAALDEDTSLFISRGNTPLSSEHLQQVKFFLQRRLNHEPLSRIMKQREFWSLPFQLNEATLDPRIDSEVVVETALMYISEHEPLTLLDFGTGSGCLLLSLLHERPQCYGVGIDLNPRAVIQALKNAQQNKLENRADFIAANWGEALKNHSFDLIISNPPYIPLRNQDMLPTEVRDFDPELALYGGNNGLKCFEEIAEYIPTLLKPSGVCVLEIGHDQTEAVAEIFIKRDFFLKEKAQDLEDRNRCLVFG